MKELFFVLELGLDVSGVNSLKICKGAILFGMWRICKKIVIIFYF